MANIFNTTSLKMILIVFGIILINSFKVNSQTPVPMASQLNLTYTESFDDIANWTDNFASGVGANRWSSNAVGGTGTIPNGTRITTATSTFVTLTSGGVQKGSGNIQLLSTGTTDNSSSAAINFHLNFTGVFADKFSYNAATVFNSTGNRGGTLRVYWSVNGTTFTELTGASYSATNNIAGSASISNISLPAQFNNASNAILRFYYHNGTGGSTGNRPKISIDNVSITATCNLADYCNLQHPSTQTICQDSSFTSYGQIYELGMTEAPDSNSAIKVEWGYNPTSGDANPALWPSGNWSLAKYNVQAGNNDEYKKTTGSILTPGTYNYTYRYSINNCGYQYGGFPNGIWNGTTQTSGVLTVLPRSVGGTVSGGGSVCPNVNSTLLTLSGQTGNVIKWQYSTDNFAMDIHDITNTNTTYTATNLTTTTSFRAVVQNTGSCSLAFSMPATINLHMVSLPNASSNSPVCVGKTLNLTSDSGFNSYSWTGPNMFSSSLEDPSITNVTAMENGSYTLIATDGNSCSTSQTITVIINNLPTANIMGLDSLCSGQTTNITATGGINYVWSNMMTNPTINVGIGNYVVTVTDNNMCSNTDDFTIALKSTNNNSNSAINESYVVVNTTGSDVYYDLQNETANENFNGFNLGSFIEGSSAFLRGGEIETIKTNGLNNICGGRIYYSIYTATGTIGSFTPLLLDQFTDIDMPPGKQIIKNVLYSVNILSGLSPDDYKIAVYVDAFGSHVSPSLCDCNPMHVQNNSGAYWIANFTVIGCTPVNAGTISGENALCVDESTTLTSDGDSGGTWTSSDPTVATINPTTGLLNALLSGSTNIKYKVNATSGCPGDSSFYTVDVFKKPTALITGSSSSSICVGATVTFNIYGNPDAIVTYNYNSGPSSTLTLDSNGDGTLNHTATSSGNLILNLTSVESSICSNALTETATVVVNALPVATISGALTFCTGGSTTLTANGAGMGGSYSWSNMVNTDVNMIATAGTYTVVVTDGNGCTDTESATVIENTLPTASISGTLSYCTGGSTTLTANGAGTGGSYSWSNMVNTAMNMISSAGTYTVVVTDGNGCTDSESATVVENSLPTASITGNLGYCPMMSTTLTASGAGTGGSYAWSNMINTATNTISSAGTYTVIITDANGCTDSESASVVAYSGTSASIDTSSVCGGGAMTLTASGGNTYLWEDNSIANPRLVSASGTYIVTVTDTDGCTASSSIAVMTTAAPIINTTTGECYNDISQAISEATAGQTVQVNIGSYMGELDIIAGVTVVITNGTSVTSTGNSCIMGTVVVNSGGNFVNTGAIHGNGTLGTITNSGSLHPGTCTP